MPMGKAHLKRKVDSETFGLADIGLVSETNVGDNRGDMSLGMGPSWRRKKAGTSGSLSREVFTIKHAGLTKLEKGQGRKASSSFTRPPKPPVAKQAVAVRGISGNSVILGGTDRDLKQKNPPIRASGRDLSTGAVAAGPSLRTLGQKPLPDPGEAHSATSQTMEVLIMETGTHEQRSEVDMTPTSVQETDCTNMSVSQTASTGLSVQAAEPFKIRAYQIEMLQESLRRNIILCVCVNL